MSDQFLANRITAQETIILNIETAINMVVVGNHASYELNTGQTTQAVTRNDASKLYTMLERAIGFRDQLLSACGSNEPVVQVIPGY